MADISYTYLHFILCLLVLQFGIEANMDFYLPEKEVEDLFGADGMQLYYIRNGIPNRNAINFIPHISQGKSNMDFKWQATDPDIHVYYGISFFPSNHSKSGIELRPSINENGQVGNKEQDFHVSIRCSGKQTIDTTIEVNFTFTFINNPTEVLDISLKRMKKCLKTPQKVNKDQDYSKNKTQPNDISISNIPSDHNNHTQGTYAFYISISVFTFIIILAVIGVRICHHRSSKNQQKIETEACMMNYIPSSVRNNQFLKPDLPNNAHTQPGSSASWMNFTPIINDLGTDILEIRTKLSVIAIPRSDIVLEETLQEGTFSKIFRGSNTENCSVLVKTVTEAASEEQTRLLLYESSLLRGMHHRNLLPIKNVILDGPEPPMVIFPYTKGGNLKRYLRDIKFTDLNSFNTLSSRRNNEQASTQDLVEMGIQIACGMAYLAKRGVVHKDLATRNCVIDENLKVKVTDNALSRDLFPADYCCLGDNENRPVRWLSMESLVHKIYSTASDVWSFGVLLWELQSLAAMPYNDIDDFEMSAYLRDGFRLSQPINCPDHLYSIMAGCWHFASDKRPTFSELLQMLMEFNAELGEYV